MDTSFHLGFGVAAVGMFIGLVQFVTTRKKNLGLAGTYVANPLSPGEKKKVYTQIGIGILVVIILISIGIPTGILTFDSFVALVGILGVLIPIAYFTVMYRSPKTTKVDDLV
jgi:proton-dependent oligopeptide transporter, POT family